MSTYVSANCEGERQMIPNELELISLTIYMLHFSAITMMLILHLVLADSP